MRKFLLAGAAALALGACSQAGTDEASVDAIETAPIDMDAGIVTASEYHFDEAGLDLTQMGDDHPGDNFYRYVQGKWLDEFEIPADRTRYGTFTYLHEKSEQRVRKIIEALAEQQPNPATLEGKVAAYFNAFMDEEAIESAGLTPAQPYLDRIAAIETREDLVALFAANGYAAPFGGYVDVDSKQTDQYILYFTQAGLGMPDRNYYLNDDEKYLETRDAYKKLLETLLAEAGYDDPAASADAVLALETRIAEAHWDRTVGRNRNLTYNKVTKDELIEMGGDFPVVQMLEGLRVADQDAFIVRQVTPTAEEIEENGLSEEQVELISGGGVDALMDVAMTAPLESWKAYLTAHFLSDHSSVLPKAIDDANFAFYGVVLGGQEEQRERWKRGVSAVEGSLGEAVGKSYADRYFPAENKAAMDELVANLRKAMAANLDDIDWMSDETKVEAREKLGKFTPKIGYPEKFETYDAMTISTDSAFVNAMAAGEWAFNDMISQLGQPIDKTEWFMLPQTVNAYYSPNRNEIVFPAAILQPPFFNLAADPAVNYGAIGGVIGHEMGHGFDDQGSRSDGDGVLRNWWTDEDRANFEELTGALAAQYDAFCPLDDGKTCVNGRLGLGENIGDLGGLSMALRAYKMSLNGEEAPVINGLTGEQRFFISWAQSWRNKYREEALRTQLVRGPHSPPRYRVNGVVRNFDEWYEAFGITEDHELYLPPEERIRIW